MKISMSMMPRNGLNVIKALHSNGYEAYFVGGCVRDLMLGKEPNDWDICTNATPEQTISALKKSRYKYHTVGIEFGTVTAICGQEEYEITTYRKDGEYSDNRRPDSVVLVSNIKDDLSRRDFTINAMAFDPFKKELIDLYGGYTHLKEGKLVAVGDADKRFKEDALRILRALRFAIKYNLEIDEDTDNAMKDNYMLLSNISLERITSELEKILTSGENVWEYFLKYDYIIGQIIPELKPCIGFDQNNKYHIHDVYEHILYVVDGCKTNKFEIKLAALLHDIGKPSSYTADKEGWGHFYGHPEVSYEITLGVLRDRLRLTKEQSDRVINLVRYHDITIAKTRASVKRALNKHGEEWLRDWFILKQADMDDHIYPNKNKIWYMNIPELKDIMQQILDGNECFTVKDLKINGKIIMNELGLKPGKHIGLILNTLLNDVIDEKIDNEYYVLLDRAKEINIQNS